jgi:hypothetical protein
VVEDPLMSDPLSDPLSSGRQRVEDDPLSFMMSDPLPSAAPSSAAALTAAASAGKLAAASDQRPHNAGLDEWDATKKMIVRDFHVSGQMT